MSDPDDRWRGDDPAWQRVYSAPPESNKSGGLDDWNPIKLLTLWVTLGALAVWLILTNDGAADWSGPIEILQNVALLAFAFVFGGGILLTVIALVVTLVESFSSWMKQ